MLKFDTVQFARFSRPNFSSKSATAAHESSEAANTFEITHPFHPLRGKKFIFTARMQLWGEDRVSYFDQHGKQRSMLASWTSVADTDYFLQASAGRSWFRVSDLSCLSLLLQQLIKNLAGGVR